ncbi:hypothetical protein [Marinivivus vitaminiproducens]|uniref:hypothetical protein n=1 Tax=Marinivivus vitaminiproducens TaxID=3035935 RepID=UPI0027A94D99|nr:hypothetical protein P4R82_12215 [Geminicoccaceae bacterium SCSIO 64248]
MTAVTGLFIVALGLAAMLSSISIWAPRRLSTKVAALGTACLFLPVAYLSFVNLLSKPKPVDLEWWQQHVEEVDVLGSQIREEEGIFLYIQMPDVSEPRSYVLPWNRDLAEQLQAAMREAEQNGGGLRMRLPFEPSLDDREPKFYALPQPMLPPKDQLPDAPPAQQFDRPGTEA